MEPDEQDCNIAIQITKSFNSIKLPSSKIKELVIKICNDFKLTEATISIAIVDDSEIIKLNTKFLNNTDVTDCLSFDLSEKNHKFFELVVNGELAARQAEARGHDSQAELALYIIHCLLHQLEFDDLNDEQAKEMHKTENKILQQQGYNLIYK